jgi:hypothetical protein
VAKLFISSEKNVKNRAAILMILILIITSYQSYYAVELSNFMLFFGILIFIVSYNLWRHHCPIENLRYFVVNLSLISLLILLGVDNIVYMELKGDYLQKLFIGLNSSVIRLMKPHELQQAYTPTAPLSALYLDLVIRTVLVLVVLTSLILDGMAKKGLLQKTITLLPLFFALLFYSILEPIVYQGITTDYIVSRNMVLYLPIASFVILGEIKMSKKRVRLLMKMITVLILVFVILRYVIISNSDYQRNVSKDLRVYITIAADRMIPYLTPRYILSSHEISSVMFVQAVIHQRDHDIYPNPFKDKAPILYEALINNKGELLRSEFTCDLIMARTFKDRQVRGEIWGGTSTISPPLGNSLYNMNNFSFFNKIYDNGMIMYFERLRPIIL